MNWVQHKQLLLKNHQFRKALQETAPELQIAKAVIEARINKGFSQKELADCINTKQSVISRVENARTIPSISFLKKVAGALNVTLQVKIYP